MSARGRGGGSTDALAPTNIPLTISKNLINNHKNIKSAYWKLDVAEMDWVILDIETWFKIHNIVGWKLKKAKLFGCEYNTIVIIKH